MLYNENIASFLLGSLMKNPSLLLNPKYPLTKQDFNPVPFHKVVFIAIARLVKDGVQAITEVELDNCIKVHDASFNIWLDNNGLEFASTVRELSQPENYEYYYNKVRKFSLLRDLQELGYDIKKFYDELSENSENDLDGYSIQDILNNYETQNSSLRNQYDVDYVRNEMIAGDGTEELLAEFEEEPAFGAFLQSSYLTQLAQGWCRGHLLLRSAPSGTGKSRMAVGDLSNVSVPYLWDDDEQDFVPNLNYRGAGFFIHTELKTREEINPMFLACIANVDYGTIRRGQLTHEQKLRVIKAGEILKESRLLLTDMPDFTSHSLERKIKECVESYGCTYGVFDYVQLQTALSNEFKQMTSVPAREDLVLKNLVTDLKSVAEKYNVGLLTSTQLNGQEKTTDFPDESCLSGAKSLKNKIDFGCICLPCKDRPKEMKKTEVFIKKVGIGHQLKPNTISYVYKARFGEYADRKIKVFSNFNKGTMRNTDFFCVNAYDEFEPIPMPTLVGGQDEKN